jgi:hypothetical protein
MSFERMNSAWSHAFCVEIGLNRQRLIGIALPIWNALASIRGLIVRATGERPSNSTAWSVTSPNLPDAISSWLRCSCSSWSGSRVANVVKNSRPGLRAMTPRRASASELNSTCGLPTGPTIRTRLCASARLRGGGSFTCSAVVSPSAVGRSRSSPSSCVLAEVSMNGSRSIGVDSPLSAVVAADCTCSCSSSGESAEHPWSASIAAARAARRGAPARDAAPG